MTLSEKNKFIYQVMEAHVTDKVICDAAITIILENMSPEQKKITVRQVVNSLNKIDSNLNPLKAIA